MHKSHVTAAINQAKVALEAGVSQSTVSRILNGSANVDADKRDRVLEAMGRLGYRPHVLAQGLARGRSMTVGVLTQHISSPFFAEVLGGVEQGLRGSSYHSIFASADWGESDSPALEALDLLISRRVDALVVLQTDAPDSTLLEVSQRLPTVVVGRSVPGLEQQCLVFDNEAGAHLGTKALIELGHTRIAHIAGPATHHEARQRLAGYKRALEEAGLPFDPNLVVEGDFLEQSGVFAVNALFARGAHFTAIFVADDLMAYGARLGLHRQGMRVPEEVSLLGFDDLRVSRFMLPPLSTIRQPTLEYGIAAARAVLDLLHERPLFFPNFAPELVRRESMIYLGRSRAARLEDD
jgi:LacI family transcriptional regulator